MDFTVLAIVTFSIYFVLWFFDSFFKSCMHYPYEAFLNGTGITIKPFRIYWYTTAFNRSTIKWAHAYQKIFRHSFDIGVFASILLLPTIVIWLMKPFIENVISKERNAPLSAKSFNNDAVEFELLLPGVNLPLEEISYYAISMGICSVVHEMGHAFAAVLEDVPLTGFGFNVLLVMPVAYTHLGSEQMVCLKTWRRLRILCAGVWHNILLASFCFCILFCLPAISMPFYHIGRYVIVKSIQRDSPLSGEKGLSVDDVVTSINNCRVTNVDSWLECLRSTIKSPPAYCITSNYVLEHDESVQVSHKNNGLIECCDINSVQNICFEYVTEEGSYSLIELPQFMCLNIRNTINHSRDYCHQARDKCIDSYCIRPMMNNATTLIQIKRKDKQDVVYMGHPSDLVYTINVSSFVPKTFILNAHFADRISLLLKYLVVFSLGLATLNVIPCFYFDGYHITSIITNHLLHRLVPQRHQRECVIIAITSIGTLLLMATLSKSLWNSIYQRVL